MEGSQKIKLPDRIGNQDMQKPVFQYEKVADSDFFQ